MRSRHLRRAAVGAFVVCALLCCLPMMALATAPSPRLTTTFSATNWGFVSPRIVFQGLTGSVDIEEGGKVTSLALGADARESTRTDTTPAGESEERTYTSTTAGGHSISWTLASLRGTSGFTLRMRFTNGGKSRVLLRKMTLCSSGAGMLAVTGKPDSWYFSSVNDRRGRSSGSLLVKEDLSFADFLTLFNRTDGDGCIFGAAGVPVADVNYRVKVVDGKASLSITSEMNGVTVDPGESRDSQEVVALFGSYPDVLPAMFRWMAVTHGARTAKGSLFGWNSWLSMWGNPQEKRVDAVLNFVKARRETLLMQLFQIDDGWEVAYGNWNTDPKMYPDGMKPLAGRIASAGMMPGIWMTLVNGSEDGTPHPDRSRPGIGGGPLIGKGKGLYNMDATHPGTRRFIVDMLKARYAEGFRYFKLDFNRPRFGADRFDKKLTHLQMMRGLFKLYRETIGEESYLCACTGGIERGALGYADSMRIGPDTMLDWNPMKPGGMPIDGGDIPGAICAIGNLSLANGILFAADPDSFYTTPSLNKKGINPGTMDAFISYVGFLGGARQTSEELGKPAFDSPQSLYRLQILSTPLVERAYAFDFQTDLWHTRFGFVAKRPWGDSVGVILLNPKDEAAEVTLEGAPLSVLTPKFHVWSFWDNNYLGLADGSLRIPAIPPHACVQLRLSAAGVHPVELLGSTLHIGMGANEIKDFTIEGNKVRILLNGQGAGEGELLLHGPDSLKLTGAGGCAAELSKDSEKGIYHLTVKERHQGIPGNIGLSY